MIKVSHNTNLILKVAYSQELGHNLTNLGVPPSPDLAPFLQTPLSPHVHPPVLSDSG